MKSVVRRGGDAAAAAVLTRRYTLAAGDFLHYFHNVVLIQKNNENSTIGVAIAGQAGGGLSRVTVCRGCATAIHSARWALAAPLDPHARGARHLPTSANGRRRR
jgi:hypothetical protein